MPLSVSSTFQGKVHFQGLFKTALYIQVLFKPVCNSACWVIFHALSSDFSKVFFFFQKIISGTLSKCQNGLDPDQDPQNSVGPDLSPNCLQGFSADDKSCC